MGRHLSARELEARALAVLDLERELARWRRRVEILGGRRGWGRALAIAQASAAALERDLAAHRAALGALYAAAWSLLAERESVALVALGDALDRSGFGADHSGERAAAATSTTASESPW